ncbi:Uncharacterised protein [Bordetella pertussis]|nr:Uncharacterised protein [Bordetella pertussis]
MRSLPWPAWTRRKGWRYPAGAMRRWPTPGSPGRAPSRRRPSGRPMSAWSLSRGTRSTSLSWRSGSSSLSRRSGSRRQPSRCRGRCSKPASSLSTRANSTARVISSSRSATSPIAPRGWRATTISIPRWCASRCGAPWAAMKAACPCAVSRWWPS